MFDYWFRQVESVEIRLGTPTPTVRRLDHRTFAPHVDAATVIYGEAMQRSPATIASRRELIRAHLTRPGFVAVGAFDGDERLIGFGYGYRGAAGQWWHDVVADGLGRQSSAQWLADSFELAELHVSPPEQGNGLGRQIIDALLTAVTTDTVLLSTPDRESPARRLYRSLGFVDLLERFRFPGSSEPYAVMGLRRVA